MPAGHNQRVVSTRRERSVWTPAIGQWSPAQLPEEPELEAAAAAQTPTPQHRVSISWPGGPRNTPLAATLLRGRLPGPRAAVLVWLSLGAPHSACCALPLQPGTAGSLDASPLYAIQGGLGPAHHAPATSSAAGWAGVAQQAAAAAAARAAPPAAAEAGLLQGSWADMPWEFSEGQLAEEGHGDSDSLALAEAERPDSAARRALMLGLGEEVGEQEEGEAHYEAPTQEHATDGHGLTAAAVAAGGGQGPAGPAFGALGSSAFLDSLFQAFGTGAAISDDLPGGSAGEDPEAGAGNSSGLLQTVGAAMGSFFGFGGMAAAGGAASGGAASQQATPPTGHPTGRAGPGGSAGGAGKVSSCLAAAAVALAQHDAQQFVAAVNALGARNVQGWSTL